MTTLLFSYINTLNLLIGLWAQAPVNMAPGETCDTAIEITSNGSYTCSGPSSGMGCNDCSGGAQHASWYKYTAECAGEITISSCNQEVDTRIFVYKGNCDGLILEDSSDNDCESQPEEVLASYIEAMEVEAGVTYFIEWDNRWSSAGFDFEFTYTNYCECIETADVIYVNPEATGYHTGCNWEDGFTDLQTAIAASNLHTNVEQIWVKAGTYLPTTDLDRSVSFVLNQDVAIYGGFAGTETMLSQRDPVLNECILSGDIDGDESINNNTYRLVHVTSAANGTILDGFQISSGKAEGSAATNEDRGAGIYCEGVASLKNCIIELCESDADGSSLYATGSASVLSIEDVVSTENIAASHTVAVDNNANLIIRGDNSIE